MQTTKKTNTTQRDVVSVQVATDLTVQVIPNHEHEFLMTSKDVAMGYGIGKSSIDWHKQENKTRIKRRIALCKGCYNL